MTTMQQIEKTEREAVLVEDAKLIGMMGFPVLEALPSRAVVYQRVDPFILLHEARIRAADMTDVDTKHPHRGFDNIWYILEGTASTGHTTGPEGAIERARLPEGGLLALRTGRGAWHAESIGKDEIEAGKLGAEFRSVIIRSSVSRGPSLLLQRSLGEGLEQRLVDIEGEGPEAPADWDHLRSGETYLGYRQATNFSSPGRAATDRSATYQLPDDLRLNEWALAGDWTISGEAATSDAPGSRVALRFHARDVHLVMGPAAGVYTGSFRVTLDGDKPGESAGTDLEADGMGRFDIPRMYQLIRQRGPVEDRLFEIEFDEPGAQALCFTFG